MDEVNAFWDGVRTRLRVDDDEIEEVDGVYEIIQDYENMPRVVINGSSLAEEREGSVRRIPRVKSKEKKGIPKNFRGAPEELMEVREWLIRR